MFYRINNFVGGLNKRLDQIHLKDNEAAELINARVDKGYLRSSHNHKLANSQVGGYYVANYFADSGYNVWFTHNNPMLYVDWLGQVFKSSANELERPKKFKSDGTEIGVIGVDNPTSAPAVAEDSTVSTPFFKDDIFSYIYTFVKGAAESAPSPATQIKLSADGIGIKVTTPLASDNGVDKIRVYRAGGGALEFALVNEFEGGTFTDDKLGLELGALCETWGNEPPPNGLIIDEYHYGRFVGYVERESVLRFSNITYVESWNPLHTIEFDSKIVRAIHYAGSLMVLCSGGIYQIAGTDLDNFTKVRIPTEQGCVSKKSVIVYNNMLFWQSEDGICLFDGAQVTVLSKTRFDAAEFKGRKLIAGAKDNVVYFADEQKIYAFNLDINVWETYESVTGLTHLFYNKADDKLYMATLNELYTLQDDTTEARLIFKSKKFGNDADIVLKDFRTVQLLGKGEFDVRLYVDDELVYEYPNVKLTSLDQVLLFYPKLARGYFTQIELVGIGQIYNVNIEAYPIGVKRNG